MPVYDFEAGSGSDHLAQFAVDFSNRIHQVMQIRPGVYIGGNYSQAVDGATASLRNQLAQPASNSPSVVGPAYPMLWNARYAYQGDEGNPGIQTANPKDTASTFYGPWDDYGVTHPWDFWQYSSTSSIPGFNAVDSGIDGDVSHGDIEYVRNFLVPAVWWNDSSGDWSTLANWNSGQPVVTPTPGAGQATPYSYDSDDLPTARLPGAAGSGPTSGQYDTVILERPSANITATLSTGTHNIRKLYMRETLNITGGSLTINYDPTYRSDNSSTVLHGGDISAQFSGAVSISGGASLSVHTLQVDATRTFTVGGNSTVALNTINLGRHVSTPAKINVNGDVNFSPLNNAAAVIAATGSGSTGTIDLTSGQRTLTVADGGAAIDLSIGVPVVNGGLTKAGAGTLALTGANTYSGDTIVQDGRLSLTNRSLANSANVYLTSGASLELTYSGTPDVINALFIDGVMQDAGSWGASNASPWLAGTGVLQVSVGPSAGDFNRDGYVNADDLDEWAGEFGNGYDGSDFLTWQRELGNGVLEGAAAATVPEPTSAALSLLALSALGGAAWRRVRSRASWPA